MLFGKPVYPEALGPAEPVGLSGRPLHETRRDQIVMLYRNGTPVAEMAALAGCGVRHVYRIIAELLPQEERRGNRGRLTESQRKRIVAEYRDGTPVSDIAATVGCAVSTSYRVLGETLSLAERLAHRRRGVGVSTVMTPSCSWNRSRMPSSGCSGY